MLAYKAATQKYFPDKLKYCPGEESFSLLEKFLQTYNVDTYEYIDYCFSFMDRFPRVSALTNLTRLQQFKQNKGNAN